MHNSRWPMQLSLNLIVMANLAAHSVHSFSASIKISNDSQSLGQSVNQSTSHSVSWGVHHSLMSS